MISGAVRVVPEAELSEAAAATLVVQAAGAAHERVSGTAEADATGAPEWQQVAAAAVEVNARISMLLERVSRSGAAVVVPDPVRLNGCTAMEASRSSAQTARLLVDAQAAVRTAVAAAESRLIMAGLPRSLSDRPESAAALAHLQRVLHGSTVQAFGSPPDPNLATIAQILRTLDLDACEREQAEVLSAAVSATRNDPREASTYLRTLREKIAAVNAAVARRCLAARWLCALEEPIVAAVEPPGALLGTAALLREIVAAESDLAPQIRAEAAEALEWAASIVRARSLRDFMNTFLTERGYTVDSEPDGELAAELRLTRPDWHREHSADVWVDRHGTVHGRVARERAVEDEQAVLREQSRCAAFNADVEALGRSLGVDVVTGDGYVPQPSSDVRSSPAQPG